MTDDLDLESGDEAWAESSPTQRRAAARKQTGTSTRGTRSTSSGRLTNAQKAENEIRDRLSDTFERIASALESKGDSEFAQVVREDSPAMSQGIVSLTHNVKPLRNPLLIVLNLVQPILAFGRVARMTFVRLRERQERIAMEHAMEQQETPVTYEPDVWSQVDGSQ